MFNLFYREGSARGFGIRINQSVEGSDSWVDDPITRHIISLCIKKEEEEKNRIVWPLVLHIKGLYCILVLPLVGPDHLKVYTRMRKRSDCGDAVGADENLSPFLLNLPSITGLVPSYLFLTFTLVGKIDMSVFWPLKLVQSVY